MVPVTSCQTGGEMASSFLISNVNLLDSEQPTLIVCFGGRDFVGTSGYLYFLGTWCLCSLHHWMKRCDWFLRQLAALEKP